jgi:hypothetical protein
MVSQQKKVIYRLLQYWTSKNGQISISDQEIRLLVEMYQSKIDLAELEKKIKILQQ